MRGEVLLDLVPVRGGVPGAVDEQEGAHHATTGLPRGRHGGRDQQHEAGEGEVGAEHDGEGDRADAGPDDEGEAGEDGERAAGDEPAGAARAGRRSVREPASSLTPTAIAKMPMTTVMTLAVAPG